MDEYQVLDVIREKGSRELISIVVTGIPIIEMEVGVELAMEKIENKECGYYIYHNGKVYYLLVKEKNGLKYLTTQEDESKGENLLETIF